MADETVDSTVAEASTTPATAEPVETTATPDAATSEAAPAVEANILDDSEPWANFGADAGDSGKDEEAKAPVVDGEAAAVEPGKTEEGKEAAAPAKEEGEKAPEDDLEKLFSDQPEEESGEPTEAELEAMPREELLNRQKNNHARKWAERNAEKAEIVKDFQFPTKPITEVAAKLAEINGERFAELSQHAAHALVDTNPDATFQRAYAVKMLAKNPNWDIASAKIPTLDEVIAGAIATPAATTTKPGEQAEVPADLAETLKAFESTVDWDWRDPALDGNFVDERELAMAKSLRVAESTAKAENARVAELQAKAEDLEKQLQGLTEKKTDTDTTVLKTKLDETISEYRTSIADKITPHILRNAGLEPSKDDTPEIADFKAKRAELYTGTEYQKSVGEESAFESFAYNQSSVAKDIEKVTSRIVDAQLKQVQANIAGDAQAAAKFQAEAEAESHPLIILLSQANKEFKAKYVTPDIELIGRLSGKMAAPILEASERVEVVANGSGDGTNKPVKREVDSAEGVWDRMVESAKDEEVLRANA